MVGVLSDPQVHPFSLLVLSELARLVFLLVQSFRGPKLGPTAVAGTPPPLPTLPTLPTLLGPAVVTGLWIVGAAIFLQSYLSGFGIGSQPPSFPGPTCTYTPHPRQMSAATVYREGTVSKNDDIYATRFVRTESRMG